MSKLRPVTPLSIIASNLEKALTRIGSKDLVDTETKELLEMARDLATGLEPYLVELNRISEVYISIHPNAGLPNAFGEYDETPSSMANYVKKWSNNKFLNIVGGCCGTTPEHIKAMKKSVLKKKPRDPKELNKQLRLAGLEAFNF